MSLPVQPLRHYSDFDGTSESETSEISIVFPYVPRVRPKKTQITAEGQIRRKNGTRALRRYENEAYLSSLVMINEMDAEYEADDYWPDKAQENTGFKCLFEDSMVRDIWDSFISLTEANQIEILGSLMHQNLECEESCVEVEDTEETNGGGSLRRCVGGNVSNSHGLTKRRTKPIRNHHKFKQPVALDVTLGDEFQDIDVLNVMGALDSQAEIPNALSVTTGDDEYDDADCFVGLRDCEYSSDGGCAMSSIGGISSKLLAFIRNSARDVDATKAAGRKKHHFSLQDLCLIQRAELELKHVFSQVNAADITIRFSRRQRRNQRWTPSTSLLRHTQDAPVGRGHPLILNGFQRMLVHATASYLGLFSFSAWNSVFNDRQLWVDNRNAAFAALSVPFVCVIRSAMQKQRLISL